MRLITIDRFTALSDLLG